MNRVGSMLGLFFGPGEVRNFGDAKRYRLQALSEVPPEDARTGGLSPALRLRDQLRLDRALESDIVATLSAATTGLQGAWQVSGSGAPFLDACNRRETEYTPVWFMRQAGRYLPSYRRIKGERNILEIAKDPSLSSDVAVDAVNTAGVSTRR